MDTKPEAESESSNLVRRPRSNATAGRNTNSSSLLIDTNFPGGNAIIEGIVGDTVRLRPDPRDSACACFHWSIRVRNASGKSITFVFTEQNPVGMYGPAVSLDEGVTWQWLGNPDGSHDSFRCSFPAKAPSVRLAFSIGYTDLHWQRFCGRIARHRSFVREDILCLSRSGRAVPRLHVGRLDGRAKYRMLLTARHHACETMANYAIEGLVRAILTDNETGDWFRGNAELVVLPFMDRDGVEDGDSGIGRRPRDHYRDYQDASIYPETAALRDFTMRWSSQKLVLMADLHCPWIRGNNYEQIYQVTQTDAAMQPEQKRFAEVLKQALHGQLPFASTDTPKNSHDWLVQTRQTAGTCSTDWFAKLPGIRLATAFEIPYSHCSGTRITVDGVRAFGADLAYAIRNYIEEPTSTSSSSKVPTAQLYVDSPDMRRITAVMLPPPDIKPKPAITRPQSATSRMDRQRTSPMPPNAGNVSLPHIVIHTKRLNAARPTTKRSKS